ncbi:response regulator [Pectobacterium aroidearum]|uniref:response regulator n=1 Tax=Pectobacterium aroidearum TaxID=1201031 RepID=UPI0032EDD041
MIKVMIVEDDIAKRDDIINFFNLHGITCPAIHVVDNVTDALNNLRKTKYDIVVLDLNLPLRKGDLSPTKDGGKKLLYALPNQRYITPTYLLGLTQFDDYQASNEPDFRQFDFNIYSYNNDTWKSALENKIRWLIKNVTIVNDRSTDRKIIILTHGIMTSGSWTRKVEDKFLDSDFEVIKYQYPNFSAFKIIFPWTRAKILKGYKDFIESIFIRNPECELNFISHSFGTFMTVKSLDESDISYMPNINNVLLCGSLLRSDYKINDFISKFNIKNLVNECGINDLPLLICNLTCYGLGHAGRIGFQGYDEALSNRYYEGGHSDFFDKENILMDWKLIIESQKVKSIDERKSSTCDDVFESIMNLISPFTKPLVTLIVLFLIFYVLPLNVFHLL